MQEISTIDELRDAIWSGVAVPKLLVCYAEPLSSAAAAVLESTAVSLRKRKLHVVRFRCPSDLPGGISPRSMLGLAALPAVIAIHNGQTLDSLLGDAAIAGELELFARRFAEFVDPQPSSAAAVPLNLAKMLVAGRDLLARGEFVSAEKTFEKGLAVLDAVSTSTTDDLSSEIKESSSSFLAWLAISRLLQSKMILASECISRIRAQFGGDTPEPGTDVARAVALHVLLANATFEYEGGASCAPAAVRRRLASDATDWAARGKLAVALFLSGCMEECATEAVKLLACKQPYGEVIMRALCVFLGVQHTLIQQSGWKRGVPVDLKSAEVR